MQWSILGRVVTGTFLSLLVVLLPVKSIAYVEGDINSDNKIGLEETIYSLKVLSDTAIPLSGTTINVPGDIPTIQQAIDAASDGDTINIVAGTYNEALEINNKILTLSGAGSASTIIDATIATVAENGITIERSPGVAINNLTVQNGAKGIYALYNSHVEIDQVVVKDCTDRGIQLDMNSNAEISGTTIDNNGRDGIGLISNSNAYITGSVTLQNNSRHGLFLYLGSTALIYEATFTSSLNDGRGIAVHSNSGIYMGASNLSIFNNVRAGIAVSGASSIEVSSDSTVTIEGSGEEGVGLHGASRLYSEGAITIRGSVLDGMAASGSADLFLRDDVVIENSGENGVGVYGGSRLYVQGALTVTGSAGDGMIAADTSNITLKGDVLLENSGTQGLVLTRASSARVTARLEILNSVEFGILVLRGSAFQNEDSANIIVKGTTTGEGIGIGLYSNAVLRASGGTYDIQQNSSSGIEAGRNSTLELRDKGTGLTAAIGNNGRGIQLFQQSSLRTDVGLTISYNTNNGLFLDQGSEASLRDIVITDNGGLGIGADDASINVSGSTIQSNTGGDVNLSFGAKSRIFSSTVGTALNCDSSVLSQGDVVCP